jgi:hypothetical protein
MLNATNIIDAMIQEKNGPLMNVLKSPLFGFFMGVEAAFSEFRWYIAIPLACVMVPCFMFAVTQGALLYLIPHFFGRKKSTKPDQHWAEVTAERIAYCVLALCMIFHETASLFFPWAKRPEPSETPTA